MKYRKMRMLSVIITAFALQTAHSAQVTLHAQQLAYPNQIFTFVCITSLTDTEEDENYNIKWEKNNELIAVNNTVVKYSGEISSFRFPTQHQLIIHNVSEEDRGMYTCILEFTSSHLPSINASKSILVSGYMPKPFCTQPSRNDTVGGQIVLVCSTEPSQPRVTLQLLNSTGGVLAKVDQAGYIGSFKLEYQIDVDEIEDGQFRCRTGFTSQNAENKECLIRFTDTSTIETPTIETSTIETSNENSTIQTSTIHTSSIQTTDVIQTTNNQKRRRTSAVQSGITKAPKNGESRLVVSNLVVTAVLFSVLLTI
ncbi:uncharacterized protein LOC117102930 [Anneissia japonica]|uniref:uncharacterized protein LOC117102930 n=1 Tax=Anneissia japonica TaxID=1529436 RepID=UPI0014257B99|nr:uncharacterized protein LOC117102930 [Anneissia japonica]